ncbi:MAG: hypothetical protein EOP48_29740, partial [Sphingobacteriales bacterium]
MKKNIIRWCFLSFAVLLVLAGCEKQNMPRALEIQKPFKYTDKYYENLRAYKKSDHQLAFGWFADYSQSFSFGLHFKGLPDSIDIVSLWGGIPSMRQNDPKDSVTSYNPTAYEEMRYVREVKGIKMVVPVIVRM